MYGLVHTIAYIKLRTALAYRTRDMSYSSSCVLGHCSIDNFTPTGIGTLTGLLSCMLNLFSTISTYFLWFNQIIMFAWSLLIFIPKWSFQHPDPSCQIWRTTENSPPLNIFVVSNQQHVINIQYYVNEVITNLFGVYTVINFLFTNPNPSIYVSNFWYHILGDCFRP